MNEPTTIAEWVERENCFSGAYTVAAKMSAADLFRAHAECVRRLSEPMTIYQLGRWSDALDAVCEVLGERVDGAYSRGMR